ncbi:MAG: ABC transporter ATP-binding protein [Rhizobiaceae bacterium]|nr:ABC transporter ATP-binding protein [Rhizobiaceae bacterium]
MSTVEIRGVSKRYGSVAALDDVSLEFADGEFFGLLGPSGSGKTTLLRSIAGFVEPDRGSIHVGGEEIARVPIYRRDIGMVFQNYALFPHMSVSDNIAFGLSVRGIGREEIRARVEDALKLVRLEGYGERRPRQLSGGQQQRVALARAVVSRPRVLLLDEPLGALDKNLRQQMQIELKQIQRLVGITTVLVTHDQEEALTLSDRIAVFNQGRVIQAGTPGEIYDSPRSAFVADFMGEANFFIGRVARRQGDEMQIVLDDGAAVMASGPSRLAENAAVRLVVRPEKMSISASEASIPPHHANRLAATVEQVVFMGSSITYRLNCAGAEVSVYQQNQDPPRAAEGGAVWISWRATDTIPVDD